MNTLLSLNTNHIGDRKHLVYGYPISGIPDLNKFIREFTTERSLRKPKYDLLHNNGYPVLDADTGMLLTGCDSTKTIISMLLQQRPELVTVSAPNN